MAQTEAEFIKNIAKKQWELCAEGVCGNACIMGTLPGRSSVCLCGVHSKVDRLTLLVSFETGFI